MRRCPAQLLRPRHSTPCGSPPNVVSSEWPRPVANSGHGSHRRRELSPKSRSKALARLPRDSCQQAVDGCLVRGEHVFLAHGAGEARALHHVQHLSLDTAEDQRDSALAQMFREIAQHLHAGRIELVYSLSGDEDVSDLAMFALELQD